MWKHPIKQLKKILVASFFLSFISSLISFEVTYAEFDPDAHKTGDPCDPGPDRPCANPTTCRWSEIIFRSTGVHEWVCACDSKSCGDACECSGGDQGVCFKSNGSASCVPQGFVGPDGCTDCNGNSKPNGSGCRAYSSCSDTEGVPGTCKFGACEKDTPTPTPTATAPNCSNGAGEGSSCPNGPPTNNDPGGHIRVCCGAILGTPPFDSCTDIKYKEDCTGCKGKPAPNADNCKSNPIVWAGCHCTGFVKPDGSGCQSCSGDAGICVSGACLSPTPTSTSTNTPENTPTPTPEKTPTPKHSASPTGQPSATVSAMPTSTVSTPISTSTPHGTATVPTSTPSVPTGTPTIKATSSQRVTTSITPAYLNDKEVKMSCDPDSHRCVFGGTGMACGRDNDCGHLACRSSAGNPSRSLCVWVEGAGSHKCDPDKPKSCVNRQ